MAEIDGYIAEHRKRDDAERAAWEADRFDVLQVGDIVWASRDDPTLLALVHLRERATLAEPDLWRADFYYMLSGGELSVTRGVSWRADGGLYSVSRFSGHTSGDGTELGEATA